METSQVTEVVNSSKKSSKNPLEIEVCSKKVKLALL